MFTTLSRRLLFHSKSARLYKQIPFLLADIGEGISEVQVLQWFVKPGQRIQQFDKIAEVQSDKAAVEITSRYDGVVGKLHYNVNDLAKVGAPLIDIDVEDEGGTSLDATREDKSVAPVLTETANAPAVSLNSAQVLVLPRVRKLASEKGVDLNQIVSKSGKITEDDVLKAAAAKVSQPAVHSTLSLKEYMLNPVRKSMARSMQNSLQIPHFGYCDDYEWGAVDSLRKSLGISALPIVIKAMSEALKEFPQINGHYYPQEQKLMLALEHNVAVAIDTDHGLVVPVIRDVQKLSLSEINACLSDLQLRAQQNHLRQADFEGATISLSNVGSIGGIWANPVIVPPQICIAALGRARLVPVYADGKLIPKMMCPWSWSADHRVIDGATLARFSQRLKTILVNPEELNK